MYTNSSDKDGDFKQRRDPHSSQIGRPTDDGQQYSTDQLKFGNEPHEGLDTQTDGLTDRQL
jgi:hypothetical protein